MKPVLSCLLSCVDHGRSLAVPSDWLTDVEQAGVLPSLCSWLRLVAGLGAMGLPDRWSALRDAQSTGQPFTALLYAISIADEGAAHTEQLVWSHVLLFQAMQKDMLPPELADSVSRVFARRWAAIMGETFRLRSPRLSVPMLQHVVASGTDGAAKASRILQAGLFAVGVAVPTWLNELLKAAQSR